MLKVLIVDDEALAREIIQHYCNGTPDIELVGQCATAAEALTALEHTTIDLMFLDLRMPGFGGLDLLRGLEEKPPTIIVSAHREHALDGYELDVVDYLLKPVNEERFFKAVAKARRRLVARESLPGRTEKDILLKVDRSMKRVRIQDISHLEAQGNFVRVHLVLGPPLLATDTLRNLMLELETLGFVQVHRSFVVNGAQVAELHTEKLLMLDGSKVPIGKTFRPSRSAIRVSMSASRT